MLGLGLTLLVERLHPVRLLRALAPAIVGSSVMGAALLLLRSTLATLGFSITPSRLLLEVLGGVVVYSLYLALCHPALFDEVRRFIARRN